ncbi:HicA protein [Rugamonas sp. FT107W]|uniref:HicA protein n=1 Tax=Duganella vulcania TaxID=2692166 RepID=A0A845HC65_9BURK|nr:HicA protein [Duganella vulcania]MYM96949.1 HicA protein [Duganella vulcania]MYN16341.1 HicA protein [Duganella vulcania]
MSRKEKLYNKLHKVPPPTDFTWEELVTLMRQHNFSESCDGSSHYVFEHITGYRFTMSKTHPSGLLKIYQVKRAREAIAACKDRV